MAYFQYIIVLLLIPAITVAQDTTPTSQALIGTEGIERIDKLNELSGRLINSDPQQALRYAEEALELCIDIDYPVGQAKAFNNIGVFYKNQGIYDEALSYYLRAREIYLEDGDPEGIATVANNIGTINSLSGDYKKALEQYKRSYRILDSLGQRQKLIGTLVNLGNVYSEMNEDYRAIEFYLQALNLNEQLPEEEKTFDPVINIGNIYFRRGELNKALGRYKRAVELEMRSNNKYGQANALLNIGMVYMEMDRPGDAEDFLLEAEKYAKEVSASPLLSAIYLHLSTLKEMNGQYREAYRYLMQHDEIEDFIHSQEMARKLVEIEIAHELDEKEAELDMIMKENELNKVRVANIRAVVIIGLMIFFLVGAGIFISYKIKSSERPRYFRKP